MKHLRLIAGILLIAGALSGLIFWELHGREAVLATPCLVAGHPIAVGSIVEAADFRVIGVTDEARAVGALPAARLADIVGLAARHSIPENGQVTREDFRPSVLALKPGQSIYLLRSEWIGMRSSSLRRGDIVAIYNRLDGQELGCFRVAFVKDEQGGEVRDANAAGEPTAPEARPLDRTASTGRVEQVEIIADPLSYNRILAAVGEPADAKLLLVQAPEVSPP